MNKYIAEFLGTFMLALAVGLSLAGKFPVPTPVVAAVTLMVCVYTLGAICGTHINPAVTLGVLSIGKMSVKDAVGYWVAQFAGGAAAYGITGLLVTRAAVTAVDSGGVFGAEVLGTFMLAFGVASVVHGKAPGPAAGLTIGGSLLAGISYAATISNGVLNPAVALGIGSFSVVYLLAPLVGGFLAMQAYKFIAKD
ncbi:MAG: aquaporin [Acidobacteria bacterium]|nr:aquaporin [Acidobacteriota bacterium]